MTDYDMEQLAEPDENGRPAFHEAFVLDTEDKVEWALRKLGSWDAEHARVKAHSESILKRIATERESFLNRFQADIEAFAKAKVEGGKRRSYETVYGTLAFRKVPPTLSVVDKDAALAWAKEHDPTSVMETLNVKSYSERAKLDLQQNGEILPGMELKPERESFSIRFKSED